MSRMNVANLKSGSITIKSAGPQSAHSPFMCKLGQGISLVHELRELAPTEEIAHNAGDEFRVYKIMRHYIGEVVQVHSLFAGSLDP